jgi:hypothetical protein
VRSSARHSAPTTKYIWDKYDSVSGLDYSSRPGCGCSGASFVLEVRSGKASQRTSVGRHVLRGSWDPALPEVAVELTCRLARENPRWGYSRRVVGEPKKAAVAVSKGSVATDFSHVDSVVLRRFDAIFASTGINAIKTPVRSPPLSGQRHLRARDRHHPERVPRPDAHPRTPPPRNSLCRVRALQHPPTTPPRQETTASSNRHAPSPHRQGRPGQATKSRPSGWPRPRVPDGGMSWADGAFGTHKWSAAQGLMSAL